MVFHNHYRSKPTKFVMVITCNPNVSKVQAKDTWNFRTQINCCKIK